MTDGHRQCVLQEALREPIDRIAHRTEAAGGLQ
jgi:hypothetical protein